VGGAQLRPGRFGEEIYKYFDLAEGKKNTISQTFSSLRLTTTPTELFKTNGRLKETGILLMSGSKLRLIALSGCLQV